MDGYTFVQIHFLVPNYSEYLQRYLRRKTMVTTRNRSTTIGILMSRKSRRQLPLEAHGILQDWLQEHLTNPYPTKEEKSQLASRTGLKIKQISTWFTNNRQRQLDPLEQWLSSSSEDEAVSPNAIGTSVQRSAFGLPDLSRRRHHPASSASSAASASSAFSQCSDAVWSGPQRKGKRKVYGMPPSQGTFAGTPVSSSSSVDNHHPAFSNTRTTVALAKVEQPSTTMSFSPATSSTPVSRQCDRSVISHHSCIEIVLKVSHKSCRRRKVKCTEGTNPCKNCTYAGYTCTYNAILQKKGPKGSGPNDHESKWLHSIASAETCGLGPTDPLDMQALVRTTLSTGISSSSERRCNADEKQPTAKYQCTFCHIELTPKAWKRHEEYQHLPKRQWVCLADAPGDDGGEDLACVFCPILSSDRSQSTSLQQCHHRGVECLRKPNIERTFSRKDNLVQHVKGFHGAVPSDEMIEAWEVKADHSHHHWKCGFCGITLESWNIRAKHIVKHFCDGLRMDSWDSNRIVKIEDEPPSTVNVLHTTPSDPAHPHPVRPGEVHDFEFPDLSDIGHPYDGNDFETTNDAFEHLYADDQHLDPFDNNWTALLTNSIGTPYAPDEMYPQANLDTNYLAGLEMDTSMLDMNAPPDFGNVEDWLKADVPYNDFEIPQSMPIFTKTNAGCFPEFEQSLPVFHQGFENWDDLLSESLGKEKNLKAELAATKEKVQRLESELSASKRANAIS